MMKRTIFSAGLTALLLSACAAQRAAPPTPAAADSQPAKAEAAPVAPSWDGDAFKVCADPNNPPYSDKALQGYENKIAELLAQELGKKVEYFWFPQRMGFIRNTIKAQLADTGEFRCDVIIGYPTGAEMVATTKPYYRSTYAIVYAKQRGFDGVKSQEDLAKLAPELRKKLKIAMFDASPATDWLMQNGYADIALPYQTMTGDAAVNTAQTLEKDLKSGKLDMAIVWGPIAGWLQYHGKAGAVALIPMHAEAGMKFEFPMSMAVRFPDKGRKAMLEQLLDKNHAKIDKILQAYHVPLTDRQDLNPPD
ncbi:MAG: quinoprotein dehydrogenase-associated putative ABC transporter substrate-binding protein [Candidatus Methylumidiphilus sp.]